MTSTDHEDDAHITVIPCLHGKELELDSELVNSGLSAISFKHGHNVDAFKKINKKSISFKDPDKSQSRTLITFGTALQRRNSFWNVHRPEMTKLNWPDSSPKKEIIKYFEKHALQCGPLCESFNLSHISLTDSEMEAPLQIIYAPPSRRESASLIEEENSTLISGNRSIQLGEEDLDPEQSVHRSRAEFCFTIGFPQECYIERSLSQQSTSVTVKESYRKLSLPSEPVTNHSSKTVSISPSTNETLARRLVNTKLQPTYINTPTAVPGPVMPGNSNEPDNMDTNQSPEQLRIIMQPTTGRKDSSPNEFTKEFKNYKHTNPTAESRRLSRPRRESKDDAKEN